MNTDFVAGFEYVIADVIKGMEPECSFDLAATPGMGRSQAFRDGARAAVNSLTGGIEETERYAAAYGASEWLDARLIREAELETTSWDVWRRAWDAARDADSLAGRRYDKRIYAERAAEARNKFLADHGIAKPIKPWSKRP